jgi:hypothetical protein
MTRGWRVATIFVALALALCAWILNLALAPHATLDDGFIYVRYAMNWVDHGELAWNVGESGTDGFTSFAFQVLSALAYLFHRADPVAAVCGAGLVAATAVVIATVALPVAHAPRDRFLVVSAAAALAAIATSAFSPQFAYWSTTLMDSPLVALSVLMASLGAPALFARDTPAWKAILGGLSLALLFVTRPEGMLVSVVVAGLALTCAMRDSLRGSHLRLRAVAPGLLAFALPSASYFVWHRVEFGYAFPNPVYVKTGVALSSSALGDGLQYLFGGPSGGLTPNSLVLHGAREFPDFARGAVVRAAINPIGSSGPALIGILVIPLLWIATWRQSSFRAPRLALELRVALLVPLGMAALVILAGGDPLFSGWRMLIPLLPAVGVAIARAAGGLRHWPLVALMLLLSGAGATCMGVAAIERPRRCAAATEGCGMAALRRLPTASLDTRWDTTSGIEDRECAAAISESFPPSVLVGQSDYMRISRWLRGRVIDLSGLVNAGLAHAPHEPTPSLFSIEALLAARPDVYFYGWTFVSPKRLASTRLDDPRASAVFEPHLPWRVSSPWPPTGATPQDVTMLAASYAGASVRLSSGLYCNFLVRRSAVGAMRASSRIEVGP